MSDEDRKRSAQTPEASEDRGRLQVADNGSDWTILKVLDWTRGFFTKKGLDSPRLDAELIIADALGKERVMLYAHFDQPLGPKELGVIRERVQRRAKNEPVAYILGHREFWNDRIEVTRAVLIPRPDTECLVEATLAHFAARKTEALRIVDVGTGSGCIAIALRRELPAAKIVATERSGEAFAIATKNVQTLAPDIELVQGSLLEGAEGLFDAIVANLPYIRSAEIATLAPDVRDYEPHAALDGGADGLAIIWALVDVAPSRLAAEGRLLLEAGADQVESLAAGLRDRGWRDVQTHRDLAGLWRVASATRP